MDADGRNVRRLTYSPRGDGHASWSPDGTRIIFGSAREGNSDIWTVRADGTDQRALVKHAGTDAGAKYSPDGRRIAFFSDREGNARLYSANADDTDVRPLTTDSTSYELAWSPDGK